MHLGFIVLGILLSALGHHLVSSRAEGKTIGLPSPQVALSKKLVAAFVKQVGRGVTVSKTDVERWHKVATDNKFPETVVLQKILQRMKSTGSDTYQMVR